MAHTFRRNHGSWYLVANAQKFMQGTPKESKASVLHATKIGSRERAALSRKKNLRTKKKKKGKHEEKEKQHQKAKYVNIQPKRRRPPTSRETMSQRP